MSCLNKPVEMIASYNTLGEMRPIKFRLENSKHEMMTALIKEVVYTKESHFAGLRTFEYGCKVDLEEREQLVEISYQVDSHKWVIKKVVCG